MNGSGLVDRTEPHVHRCNSHGRRRWRASGRLSAVGWAEEERPSSGWAPDDVTRWAIRGHGLWRSAAVDDALRQLMRHGPLAPSLEAACLLSVGDEYSEDEIDRALAVGADPAVDADVGARLLGAAARALGLADPLRAARALDRCRERAAAATTPLGLIAPARVEVESALRGHEAGVLTAALDRLIAACPPEPDDHAAAVLLSLRLPALRRLQELGAPPPADTVGGAMADAELVASRLTSPAMVCGLLATAAEVALTVDRPADALRLADEAAATAAAVESDAPPALREEIDRLCARARWRAGDRDTAIASLVAAGRHEQLVGLWCEDGYRALVAGRIDDVRSGVEGASAAAAVLAASLDGPEAVAAHHRVTAVIGTLAAGLHEAEGDPDRQLASWKQVIEARAALGQPTVDARSAAGLAAAWAGDPSAGPLFEAAEEELNRGAHGWPAPLTDASRALLLHRRGQWRRLNGRLAEAATDAGEAAGLYRRLGLHGDAADAVHELVVAQRLDGDDLDLVLATVETGLADCHRAGLPPTSPTAAGLHGLAAVALDEAGRPADAERHRRAATGPGEGDDADGDGASLEVLEREQEARWGELDPGRLAALAADPEPAVRRAVAVRVDLPDAVVTALLDDADPSVREAAGANPTVSLELIDPTARKWRSAPAVHRAAARRPDATPEMLRRLAAKDARWDVRRYVAANPSTPPDLLRQLAYSDPAVRAATAANPNTAPEVLETLSHDISEYVRFEVAGNPSATQATVASLAKRRSPWVRGRAVGNAALGAEGVAAALAPMADSAWILRAGATNPACPQELADQVLTWLALGGAEGDPAFDPVTCTGHPGPDTTVDPDQWYWKEARHSWSDHSPLWRVRAHYPDRAVVLTSANQERLRRDPVPEVRRNLFRFQLTTEHLEELADDEDATVRSRAAYGLAQRNTPQARQHRRRARWRARRHLLTTTAGTIGIAAFTLGARVLLPALGASETESRDRPGALQGTTTTVDPFSSVMGELERAQQLGMPLVEITQGERAINEGLSIVAGPELLGPDAEVVVGQSDSGLVVRIAARQAIVVDRIARYSVSLDSGAGLEVASELSVPAGARVDVTMGFVQPGRIVVIMGDEQVELIPRER